MHTHDDNPCWDAHCAPHLTHHDAATRELIARAEARGAERVARAVERLADDMAELPSDVTEGELRVIIRNPDASAQWMQDHLRVTRRGNR